MIKISRIISASNKKAWIDAISKLPPYLLDIYYYPDYINLYCTRLKKGFLFFYQENDKIWVNFFIIRKINYFRNLKKSENLYDAETPYGYGGPICNNNDPAFIKKANIAYLKYIKKSQILVEFTRFHPLINNENNYDNSTKIIPVKKTCILDLNYIDSNNNFYPFKSKIKNILKNCYKKKLSVQISNSLKYYNYFREIYVKFILKKKADKEYLFNKLYFKKLFELISKYGFIATVVDEKNNAIASGIFFYGKKFLHYHLSASNDKKKINGVFNLMIFESALYGKKIGLHKLHLGGGITNELDDPLFTFKKSMSSEIATFHVGERINNQAKYQKIIKTWSEENPELEEKFSYKILKYRLN